MMNQRIAQLLDQLNNGIYEKETEIALSLLAAVAGQSIILLGPPGVAKSMVARRVKAAFRNAQSFEYLMSRFSTPDEIFGPVSISKLKDADRYERAVEGYLPTADVAFLDEIWKAGPAIQNTLLTVINEKLFRNGTKELHLPLKLLVAASNELPARGEGLEALWDRFLIRLESRSIRNEELFCRMLLDDRAELPIDEALQISNDEYQQWQRQLTAVTLPADVLRAITQIRRALRAVSTDEAAQRREVYVSDRRWKNIVRLLRASAFLQGRDVVVMADLMPVYHCLWQEPEERDGIRSALIGILFDDVAQTLNELKENLKKDIKTARAQRAAGRISRRQMERDADKKIYNEFYYRLADRDGGNTFVVMADYRELPDRGDTPMSGVLYKDRRRPRYTIVRAYDTSTGAPVGSTPVELTRDDQHLYIDGVRFALETLDRGDAMQLPFVDAEDSGRNYDHEIDELGKKVRERADQLDANLFISADDKAEIREYLKGLFKEIAFTRQDLGKL